MPKQLIYSADAPPFLRTPDGYEYPTNGPQAAEHQHDEGAKFYQRGVHVGWMRDRHVEVGVAMFDPSREMPSEGTFLLLDRAACNRLITALRKARDSAYGRDA